MNMFRRFVFLFAALGALLCSCGGRHSAQAVADAVAEEARRTGVARF